MFEEEISHHVAMDNGADAAELSPVPSHDHHHSRTELFIGHAAMQRLHDSHVAVFGVGGVGGYAVEALVRAGIGRLTLVDFDRFCVTNLNRQLHATVASIGAVKVEVVAQRCRQINPDVEIVIHPQCYAPEQADRLLGADYDYVLDCIDGITAKIDLIQQCWLRKLPIISAMGAGNKIDPTRVQLADLFATRTCRLARILRKELRRRGVVTALPVVYSTEEYRPEIAPPSVPRISGGDWQKVTLGSISTIPALFGMMMAARVLQDIVQQAAQRRSVGVSD